MKCFVCNDGTLIRGLAMVEGQVKRKKYKVEALALVCDRCGHIAMEGYDTQEFMRKLADAYRSEHKLLMSNEIRAIRGGLSQQRFAAELGVGPASVKRWELGLVQDKGNDRLMRDFARQHTPTWRYETAVAAESECFSAAVCLWELAHGPPFSDSCAIKD